jgi:hypothetical protein
MKPESKTTKSLLVAAIDCFLGDDSLNEIRISRSQSGEGIESANVFEGTPPRMVVYAAFKQGTTTIQDKDPNWRETLLKN